MRSLIFVFVPLRLRSDRLGVDLAALAEDMFLQEENFCTDSVCTQGLSTDMESECGASSQNVTRSSSNFTLLVTM